MDPDYPDGRIFLFYNTGNVSEPEVLKGNGFKQCWYVSSSDKGQSWSDPVEITKDVFLANRSDIDSLYNHPEDWRYYANTPGHAIQLQEGEHKGRIYVAANHSYGDPQPNGKHYIAHGFIPTIMGRVSRLATTLIIREAMSQWQSNCQTAL